MTCLYKQQKISMRWLQYGDDVSKLCKFGKIQAPTKGRKSLTMSS